jgi:hypothetical protein
MKMARLFAAALLEVALMSCAGISYAQTPSPFEAYLSMTGPAAAVSGQEVTYTVSYRLAYPTVYPSATVAIAIPRFTTYVSTRTVSGTPGRLSGAGQNPVIVVRWGGLGSPEEPEGAVELVVRIDANFVGTIVADAYVPGNVGSSGSNGVRTQVYAPGTLPLTGSGGPDSSIPAFVTLLAMLGIALLAAGALASLHRSLAPGP